MLQARSSFALTATLALAISGCGEVKPDTGNVDAGLQGVTICSKVDEFPKPCGHVNMFLCNSSDASKNIRTTRSFAVGSPDPLTRMIVTPAKADLQNGLAPFIGRDEADNSTGMCAPVTYRLEVQQ